jgi:hypothetical protein
MLLQFTKNAITNVIVFVNEIVVMELCEMYKEDVSHTWTIIYIFGQNLMPA